MNLNWPFRLGPWDTLASTCSTHPLLPPSQPWAYRCALLCLRGFPMGAEDLNPCPYARTSCLARWAISTQAYLLFSISTSSDDSPFLYSFSAHVSPSLQNNYQHKALRHQSPPPFFSVDSPTNWLISFSPLLSPLMTIGSNCPQGHPTNIYIPSKLEE